MNVNEDQVKCIKNIVLRGFVAHSEIIPRLNHAGISKVNPDNVANLVIRYKAGFTNSPLEKFLKFLGSIVDKIITFIFSLLTAGIFAEIIIAKVFSDTIIKNQITGFGDNLLFWLGIKKLNLSSIDMLSAVIKMMSSTLDIIKGMIIGAICGFFIWRIITRLARFIYKRQMLRNDIKRLLKRYE